MLNSFLLPISLLLKLIDELKEDEWKGSSGVLLGKMFHFREKCFLTRQIRTWFGVQPSRSICNTRTLQSKYSNRFSLLISLSLELYLQILCFFFYITPCPLQRYSYKRIIFPLRFKCTFLVSLKFNVFKMFSNSFLFFNKFSHTIITHNTTAQILKQISLCL